MLFFGHIFITFLAAYLFFSIMRKDVDYRLIIIGSLLPDIIDKPIGLLLFGINDYDGRLFAHTLVFVAILAIVGLIVVRCYKYFGLILLALCSLVHLAMDSMWSYPKVLYWPFTGWQFTDAGVPNIINLISYQITSNPRMYMTETLGFIVMFSFFVSLHMYNKDHFFNFIRTGRIPKIGLEYTVKPIVRISRHMLNVLVNILILSSAEEP